MRGRGRWRRRGICTTTPGCGLHRSGFSRCAFRGRWERIFIYRHLLDGDPASNTLSWRWVAGLHTKGKHYLACADEFVRYPLHLPAWNMPKGRIGHLMVADDLGPPPCVVHAARAIAVDDAVARAGGKRLYGDLAVAVRTWMRSEKLDGMIAAYPTVGPCKGLMDELAGHVMVEVIVRPWGRALWPHATAGFFRMREKLPSSFQTLKNGAQESQMRLFP